MISLSRKKCACGDAFLAAEPENVRLRRHALGDFRIIGVQHGHVALQLVFEHAHFGVGVFFECSVAVEMVGSEIQQHADFRAELVNRFQLKAADFSDRHGRVGGPFHQREQRRADIAADQRGNVRCLQNVRE